MAVSREIGGFRMWVLGCPGRGRAIRPLLERRISTAGEEGGVWRYETVLCPDFPRYLGDHKVFGAVILPGACFLEMACEAAREICGPGGLEFVDVETERVLERPG